MLETNLPASSKSRPIQGNGSFLVAYQLKEKHVVVVGGGREAANRTFFALDSSANVTVISPAENMHPAVRHRIDLGLIDCREREFLDIDLETEFKNGSQEVESTSIHAVDMVLVCIDDHKESERIAKLARKLRIPVNCADIPELCDFYFMAQYREKDLQIAISTNGGGPRLGARIRNDIVANLNPSVPMAVSCVAGIRQKIRKVDTEEKKANGLKELSSRMGWVSRFCDSWSYDQLQLLTPGSQLSDQVIDAFRVGKTFPSPPEISSAFNHSTAAGPQLPAQLTSIWWCPSSMGYYSWADFVLKYWTNIFFQILRLIFIHLQLLVWIPSTLKSIVLEKNVKEGEKIEEADKESSQILVEEASVDQSVQTLVVQVDSKNIQHDASNASTFTTSTQYENPNASLIVLEDIREQYSLETDLSSDDKQIMIHPIEKTPGTLYLVGSGPGEPDMLTVMALRVLLSADLVVSDRLIPPELLQVIDPSKLILSSFKVGGASDKSQDESNEICLTALQEGKVVARFKTGDPFVFARGGEEILFFRKFGFEPKIVPGISSVFAAPSWNGIPITHRGVSDQVLVISGRGHGGTFPKIPTYHDSRTTIILMSLSRLQALSELLMGRGYPAELPCAVIEKGTWRNGEKICQGTLETISQQAIDDGISNPAMFVIGNVFRTMIRNDHQIKIPKINPRLVNRLIDLERKRPYNSFKKAIPSKSYEPHWANAKVFTAKEITAMEAAMYSLKTPPLFVVAKSDFVKEIPPNQVDELEESTAMSPTINQIIPAFLEKPALLPKYSTLRKSKSDDQVITTCTRPLQLSEKTLNELESYTDDIYREEYQTHEEKPLTAILNKGYGKRIIPFQRQISEIEFERDLQTAKTTFKDWNDDFADDYSNLSYFQSTPVRRSVNINTCNQYKGSRQR